MNVDVIVIGAGIFGGTIARALQAQGREVLVLDDFRPNSGSAPSGCLMKPSWFDGLGKEVHEPSLALLDRIYGIRKLEFEIWPVGKRTEVMWVPANKREGLPIRQLRVTGIRDGHVVAREETNPARGFEVDFHAKMIVVAAGVWCGELMKVDGLSGKMGASFTMGGRMKQGIIKPWAPYKQVVAFQQPDSEEIWMGDGSAIKPENWDYDRAMKCLERCGNAVNGKVEGLDPEDPGSRLEGIRPFVKGAKPCLLEHRAPGLWLCTGGGKNGTIAAGWAASKLMMETR